MNNELRISVISSSLDDSWNVANAISVPLSLLDAHRKFYYTRGIKHNNRTSGWIVGTTLSVER